jgi:hypothetical protein
MSATTAITFTTDTGTVTGAISGDSGGVVLGGDEGLVASVAGILSTDGPDTVRVLEPNVDYRFTPGRDTAADVAAAMLAVGAGRRGRLDDTGLDALTDALGVADLGLIF